MICATLTWLRDHKRAANDISVESLRDQLKDEPDWILEQTLRRKREELSKRWEEREERLRKLREKERELEKRGAKRRRLEGTAKPSKEEVDEDEWLLGAGDDEGDGSTQGSGLSKETRDMMTRLGILHSSSLLRVQPEEAPPDEIKVCTEYASYGHQLLR